MRAPRDANREAILAAVRERPGASAGELAAAADMSRGVAYGQLKALTESGEIVKRELPGGVAGYAPAPEAAAPGWCGGQPTSQDCAAPDQAALPSAEPAAA
ncbi:helix-turn-helix domain-containing protein [Candidatus Solirubrobacter pratensis]|uniref:helix-turn-helix domain-containing protein n=1 Tax=Candidatus Solirubrobacter pratensis TaxID=1298857 RepID=UPI000410D163|nr:helix-turn-helix domain-containing protein [Candidatus Solirubrobacter pratensis]